MHPEQRSIASSYCSMQSGKQYRVFAEECRRLMEGATERQRRILDEMAQAWLALAETAERKERRGGDQVP
jgi:hypothetical protein